MSRLHQLARLRRLDLLARYFLLSEKVAGVAATAAGAWSTDQLATAVSRLEDAVPGAEKDGETL
jgi:hypothetical protein